MFATGRFGTPGNAIDSKGRLVQSEFAGNRVARVEPDGSVSTFAESALFNCPNGITRAADGTLFVVHFSDGRVLEVNREGRVEELAVLPGGRNGHVTIARGELYITSFQGHRIYRVTRDGSVTPVAGSGTIGELDGPALEAAFTFPNGIAAGPGQDRVPVDDSINRFPPTAEAPPAPRSTVRQLTLAAFRERLAAVRTADGVDAMRSFDASWKSDPGTASLFTEVEVDALGYGLLKWGRPGRCSSVVRAQRAIVSPFSQCVGLLGGGPRGVGKRRRRDPLL